MTLEDIYYRYTNTEIIYIEDLIADLRKATSLKFNTIAKIINLSRAVEKFETKDLQELLYDYVITESDCNLIEALLRSLNTKIILNKKLTDAIENTLVNMIDTLVEDTDSIVIYYSQAAMIFSVLERVLLWKSTRISRGDSGMDILCNMDNSLQEIEFTHPNLYAKLIKVFNNCEALIDEDIYYSFPLEKESFVIKEYVSLSNKRS